MDPEDDDLVLDQGGLEEPGQIPAEIPIDARAHTEHDQGHYVEIEPPSFLQRRLRGPDRREFVLIRGLAQSVGVEPVVQVPAAPTPHHEEAVDDRQRLRHRVPGHGQRVEQEVQREEEDQEQQVQNLAESVHNPGSARPGPGTKVGAVTEVLVLRDHTLDGLRVIAVRFEVNV